MTSPIRRILFLSNDLKPIRGGNAVAAWMLEALGAPAYDVTVLTWLEPDFAAIDSRFGTSLASRSWKLQLPRPWERWLIDQIPDSSEMQRSNFLLRYAKRMGKDFDAVVSCSSFESDLGVPGIQYLHFPYLQAKRPFFEARGDVSTATALISLARRRLQPWMYISGYSFDRMRRNHTLTNSEWTRREIREAFDMDSVVVYPPVGDAAFARPWDEREDGFVCIGWFEGGKRQDWILETLVEVHRRCPSVRLHLCGSKVDSEYLRQLEAAAKKHGPWVQMHYDLSNHELLSLVGRQKYGIHAKFDEHFGIAPATFACGGCIPFVHDSGGQVEIVNRRPELCFNTREDAVSKILTVLRDSDLQDEIRRDLLQSSVRFSPESFMRNIRHQIDGFIARSK